jgi:DNA-binding CsgD family transcriptional regulator/PAS domain-containing protein
MRKIRGATVVAGSADCRAGDRFITAVEAIYDAAPDPTLWPHALQAIADIFDDVGTVMLWCRDDGSIGTVASASLAAAQKEYQEEGWNQRDIRSIRATERAVWLQHETVTERHVMRPGDLDSNPFYTDFLARHGLRYCMATGISPDPHIAVALSVQRASDKPPYDDAELETMARLGRHAEKSLRLSIRLLDAELSNLGLREALSRIGIGVFALDSLGRVVFSNPAGERLLGDGLSIAQERLRIGPAAARGEVEGAIAATLRGETADLIAPPKPMLIERGRSERPLTVYVLPVRGSSVPVQEFLTHVRAIVLAIDPQAGEPPDPAVVRDLLGLTLGEARIASLVGSGLAPREAAERLGITEETARTALKRVFSKAGVSRQSELTALLTRLVLR